MHSTRFPSGQGAGKPPHRRFPFCDAAASFPDEWKPLRKQTGIGHSGWAHDEEVDGRVASPQNPSSVNMNYLQDRNSKIYMNH
jgi:hypothetical protein